VSVKRAFVALLGAAGAVAVMLLLGARPAGADTVSDEQQFVAKINELRASKGLSQLTVDPNLTAIARNWAQSMAAAGDISHNPSLKDLVTSNWSRLGENVGVGGNVSQLFDAFVASPHHYANLIDPLWTKVGVGVVMSGTTMYTSHEFMTLRGGTTAAPPTTRKPATTIVTTPRPPPTAVPTTRPPVTVPARPVAPPAPVVVVTDLERFVIASFAAYDPQTGAG
jgi:cysteine-rich secretory family protein